MRKSILLVALMWIGVMLFTLSCEKDLLTPDPVQSAEHLKSSELLSGDSRRACGMTGLMDKLLQDPDYRRFHETKFQRIESGLETRSNDTVRIPVAIHFQGANSQNAACLRLLAGEQIAALNRDFQGRNQDLVQWTGTASNYFPGITAGATRVKFVLATRNHPGGFGLSDGDPAVTINQTNGDFDSRWSGYLNIFVITNADALGYAPLGGEGNGDGVVVDAGAFGTGRACGNVGAQAPFDLGRTLTHEVGHYLLLDHIWGNGCSVDDDVSDTPNQREEYYDCPSLGQSSCGSTDLHMNYMDYVNDACMYMFTAGQTARMEAYLATSLSGIVQKGNSVLTAGDGNNNGGDPTPTCNDGIQNGNETGVDCGGSCGPCTTPQACEAPTGSSATSLNATTVLIEWPEVPDALRYRIQYRRADSNDRWTRRNTWTNSTELTRLSEGATYEYQLRTECRDNGWTDWSALRTFTTGANNPTPSGCQENTINLRLTLDYFGSETTWQLEDERGNILFAGGPYQDGQEGKVIRESFCVSNGCYYFVVFDEYGDGICCDYGNGSYELTDGAGKRIAYSDGYFGYSEEIGFCTFNARQSQAETRQRAPRETEKDAGAKRAQYLRRGID